MRHALLISVAAAALAAGSTLALAQGAPAAPGGGANAPHAAPSQAAPSQATPSQATPSAGTTGAAGATAPGGPNGQITETPAPGKAAQDRTIPEKKSTQQVAPGKPASKQQQGEAAPHAQPGASKQGAAERHDGTRQGAAQQHEGGSKQGAAERPMTSKNVSLTTEQKTTIRSKVLTSSAPRISGHVSFDIKVGVVVPRTVRVAPVPVTIVEIEPTWRGYMYFVSGDEIIIVEPSTLRIVAVLDV